MVMARDPRNRKSKKAKERIKKESTANAQGTEGLKKRRGRKPNKPSTNAARERSRVQNLKQAFLELQKALPNVPQGTKLSKLDILLLASNYISHLMSKLSNGHLEEHLRRLKDKGVLHPIKAELSLTVLSIVKAVNTIGSASFTPQSQSHFLGFVSKWPMRSRLYVSDPMWLYRSQVQEGQDTNKVSFKKEEGEDFLGTDSPHSTSSDSSSGTDSQSWNSEENDVPDDMESMFDGYDTVAVVDNQGGSSSSAETFEN